MSIWPHSEKAREGNGASKPQARGDITYEDIVRVKERREIEHLKSKKSPLNKILLVLLLIGCITNFSH
ncbi:MAG: hypothetical protein KGH64_03545 [Candidatus Micrarchaeota archaeon]|nr:hypothetical protein [Candidatus Micrarchaeota archaeon]MDE1859689.1 hypothetical protein [Candidatus Micrarchaeota archaeon]